VHRLTVPTERREQFVDITRAVAEAATALGVGEGALLVYSPHTTAGITINEGYDPDVAADVLGWMADRVPHRGTYAHAEGNSDSHIKTIMTGTSQIVPVAEGRLQLGRWQAVFLCEFDGPRRREVWVTALDTRT
jgi:secondary thiamine-phosphate synthase enzyme